MALAQSLEVLGLDGNALVVDVKTAYWAKAFKQHPDHGGTEQEFSTLVEAYREVLAYAAGVPCQHCEDGYTKMLDKNFKVLSSPCPHCMGTGKRG